MTTQELFNKHASRYYNTDLPDATNWNLEYDEFAKALTEHDKMIRDKIEEMIKKYKKVAELWKEQYHNKGGDSLYTLMIDANAKIAALTELKQWMELK